MSVQIAITVILLCAAKVQCGQESFACLRKESNPGVLTLTVGSEVLLGCRGDIIVDGVPLVINTKFKERLEKRGDTPSHWKAQKSSESVHTTEIYHSETKSLTTTRKYKIISLPRTYAKSTEFVTNNSPSTSYTQEQLGTGHILQAVKKSTTVNSVGRVIEEGEALSVTTEMGLRTERSTSTEYEEDEDYEDLVDGLRVTRSIKRQAQWMWNGRPVRDGLENGGALRLPALQLNRSGNYSCYRRGKLISSVKISIGIPPERPTLSCYKKSHIGKIRCEWISKQPIVPIPQCFLLLRKGLESISRVNCSYSALRSRCWCALASNGTDRHSYTAKLCVTNTAGNATSAPYSYILPNIIKPDPPARVVVKPINGEPHTLKVSWFLPTSWRQSYYYILCFELIYRPLHAKEFQQVNIHGDTENFWLISDALPCTQYEIKIRAKDEFDGQWSDWTSPVYAQTWTAPETTVSPEISTSLGTVLMFSEGSGGSEYNVDETERPTHIDSEGATWVYVLWAVGVCLLITIITLSGYALRHRIPFLPKQSKESVSSTCTCSSPSPLIQEPLVIQKRNYQEKQTEGIHLHNVDYFFSSL